MIPNHSFVIPMIPITVGDHRTNSCDSDHRKLRFEYLTISNTLSKHVRFAQPGHAQRLPGGSHEGQTGSQFPLVQEGREGPHGVYSSGRTTSGSYSSTALLVSTPT